MIAESLNGGKEVWVGPDLWGVGGKDVTRTSAMLHTRERKVLQQTDLKTLDLITNPIIIIVTVLVVVESTHTHTHLHRFTGCQCHLFKLIFKEHFFALILPITGFISMIR